MLIRGVLAVCALLMSVHALAQGTITAGSASYVLGASHFDFSPDARFIGVGNGNQLIEAGWWFRIQGDGAETAMPAPNSQTYVANLATINYANVSGRQFAVTKTIALSSSGAGRGQVETAFQVTNNSLAAMTLHLFHYADLDVNGSANLDSATLVTPNNYIRVNDSTAGQCELRAPGAAAYLVREWGTPDVAILLSDTTATTFDNTGLPFVSGDITAGFQWTLFLGIGQTATVRAFIACNEAALPVELMNFRID